MKRFLSIVLSILLTVSVTAVASISVSAATVDDTVWCYIGDWGQATENNVTGEQWTTEEYSDGTSALEAAFEWLKTNTLSNPKTLIVNKPINLIRQLKYEGSATVRFKTLDTLSFTPEDPSATTAINFNGKNLYLYGSKSSVPENDNFVGYNGNAFFDNVSIQTGNYFKGDISVNNCKSFGVLGNIASVTIAGNLILTGTGVSSASKISGTMNINGNIDISGISKDQDIVKSSFQSLKDNNRLSLGGEIITEKPTVTEPTITMDAGASMRIDNKTHGIRFSATVEKDVLDAYTAAGATVTEVGTLIAKQETSEDKITIENAVESTEGNIAENPEVVVAKYANADMQAVEGANVYTIVGSLVELKPKNAEQGYVAKAYIKFKVGTETKVVYSNLSDARSIKEVATSAKADTDYYSSLCATHKAAIDKWVG